jgi:ribose transport system ATP-binding protein
VVSSEFDPPFDGHVLLNAMFGRRTTAAFPEDTPPSRAPSRAFENDRPIPRPISLLSPSPAAVAEPRVFELQCPDIPPGSIIPERYAEDSRISPRLVWSGVPDGTSSLAISITDPDLPPEFNLSRAFAHWLVHDIPAEIRELPEGASQTALMPPPARELNSDFVTFGIPGFGRGYGGPWPPDRRHRYVFRLYALKVERLQLQDTASFQEFSASVLPVTIDTASFVAYYGPARKQLPSS